MTKHLVERIIADVEILRQGGHLQAHQVESITLELKPIIAAPRGVPLPAALPPRSTKPTAVPRPPSPPPQQDLCRAIWPYSATDTDELEFAENDTIVIVERVSDGWWKGYVVDAADQEPKLVPSNYCEEIQAQTQSSSYKPPIPKRNSVTASNGRTLPPAYNAASQQPRQQQFSSLGPGKWQPGRARWTSGSAADNAEKEEKLQSPPPPPASSSSYAGGSNYTPLPNTGQQPVLTPQEEQAKKEGRDKFKKEMGHTAARGFATGVGFGLARRII
ncbi:hypothetical protein FA10DRAFT_266421 [Acaromyces ingoldii]|uniref:SH3 domain-containing protein n=1 Tax=Acaromyces ingoldii TaxID=215250 RepID=A0A316YM42_9BASI|nr:hypothetical protein FA10DRAFT_266421 [Acaromyces ingoldii]PWN89874.1 hypothetical protein FA10DRAFT_266421 [Acaromyces ingoldii]